MMNSIAQGATQMSAAQFSMEYATGVTKKVMDTTEQMAANILQMLPPAPQVTMPKGQFIDVYA